jgi:hypothetical protein
MQVLGQSGAAWLIGGMLCEHESWSLEMIGMVISGWNMMEDGDMRLVLCFTGCVACVVGFLARYANRGGFKRLVQFTLTRALLYGSCDIDTTADCTESLMP